MFNRNPTLIRRFVYCLAIKGKRICDMMVNWADPMDEETIRKAFEEAKRNQELANEIARQGWGVE